MTFRERMAIAVPPLLLRLALAVTFIWAGWGKLFSTVQFSPERTAILANMGVTFNQAQPGSPPPPANQPAFPDEGPTEAEQDGEDAQDERADLDVPGWRQVEGGGVLVPVQRSLAEQQGQEGEESGDEEGEGDQADEPPADEEARPDEPAPDQSEQAAPPPDQTAPAPPRPRFSAEDFPAGVNAKRVYNVALVIHRGANPPPDSEAYFPAAFASGGWPVRLAWGVGIVEFAGGVFVLLGLFTRLAALGLVGVMTGAVWLSELGPVIFGPADTPSFLGFLPPLDGFNPGAWMHFLWQLALLMMALAVFFAGPGALAVDSLLFSKKKSRGEKREVHET